MEAERTRADAEVKLCEWGGCHRLTLLLLHPCMTRCQQNRDMFLDRSSSRHVLFNPVYSVKASLLPLSRLSTLPHPYSLILPALTSILIPTSLEPSSFQPHPYTSSYYLRNPFSTLCLPPNLFPNFFIFSRSQDQAFIYIYIIWG